MPSPGHTTLTRLPSGDFHVDSFFDVTYQIDFVGAPGSILEGLSGSTTATIRMQTEPFQNGIPDLSTWGMILLTLVLLAILTVSVRRRAQTAQERTTRRHGPR